MLNQGTAYTSREVKESLEAHRIRLDEVTIKTPGTTGTVERYNAPMRLANLRIRTKAGLGTSGQECLKLAVLALKCTVGPEGLYLALLVFGVVTRPGRTSSALP